MLSIVNFKYNEKCIDEIEKWAFGKNWPAVYITYNNSNAYVGETLDAVRRTKQHLSEDSFKDFSDICLISSRTFNKSVILDLESYLIKYMSADESKSLTNANLGIVDHDYFYKEAYEDDFKRIWQVLKELGIVSGSISDIENSELFKYSPYKSLTVEQKGVAFDIIRRLCEINDATEKSLLKIAGGAGTGKTILAVYLVKLLKDISDDKKVWLTIDDAEDAMFIEKMSIKLRSFKRIGFVVPMVQLRTTIKRIFASIDGLSEDMVLSPEEVVKSYYDVLIVDEAHRLYRRKHLPGSHLYVKFDAINRNLMGAAFTKTEKDLTELDWIIRSSRLQVLFYDEYQTIRVPDIGPERFDSICESRLYYYHVLLSQMRCQGGEGYYDYIRYIIETEEPDIKRYRHFDNYELKVFDTVKDLSEMIDFKNNSEGLCRLVTGPGWSIGEPIMIEGESYHWGNDTNNPKAGDIFSIHKIQGFDLNYSGVIFGKEVYYDETRKRIAVNKAELKDSHTKSMGEEYMYRYVYNIYITLMTRGIKGTYVYAVDEKLRDYLRTFLG